jgi:antitoxin component YwqK of YwqJK toxin-antitoxin module
VKKHFNKTARHRYSHRVGLGIYGLVKDIMVRLTILLITPTEWFEDGQKESEINYHDGKKNGLATEWYENGQKESEINYEEGEKVSETDYKDELENGLASRWYENGPKKSETNYENRI